MKTEHRMIIHAGIADVETFKSLRRDTDWGVPDDAIIRRALEGSLYGAVATLGGRNVGMIRIVGDGALNVYIQDVIVTRSARGKGIGRALVLAAIDWLRINTPQDITVGLMAASGQADFYSGLGWSERPSPNAGSDPDIDSGPQFGPGMSATLSDLLYQASAASVVGS